MKHKSKSAARPPSSRSTETSPKVIKEAFQIIKNGNGKSEDRKPEGRKNSPKNTRGRDSGKNSKKDSKPAFKQNPRKNKRSETPDKRGGPSTQKAIVDKNPKGFAFLILSDKGMPDVFVPPRQAERLFTGDLVQVTLNSAGEPSKIEVLEHRFKELVGHYTPHPQGKGGWVAYEKKKMKVEIYIPETRTRVRSGDWVRTKLHFHDKGPFAVTGEILHVYGATLPASADLQMIASEFNLEEKHSHAAEDEVKKFPLRLSEKDFEGRRDLRSLPLITIDGETARDFDDAVYVERNKTGYSLWVAIADVSYYVREGTLLDKEARQRGTSVYFPERAFHMLPRTLSENLCSLKPNEPRLTQVAKIDFTLTGKKLSTEVMEAVIESKRRATYEEIQTEWLAHQKDGKTDPQWEYSAHFELYQALRKVRTDRGSIDFELPEAEVVVDPNGEVIAIKNRPRLDTHRLIEEFMIAANESVTEWMMERKWPFVFRTHPEPSEESLKRFQAIAATVGIKLAIEGTCSPKIMADMVRDLEGHPAQTLLNISLLRSLKQAIYTSTHGIHFGLASDAYTHFTSPIRRYPDLVVHRLIRMALQSGKKGMCDLKPHLREKLEKDLQEVCEHCSYRERLAADADREAIRVKQVRAIQKRIGDEFEGRIVGMIMSGFFVQVLDPYVEGMVPIDSVAHDTDDSYEFSEERMVFVGLRRRRTFKIGDIIRVIAVRADLDRRQIDFAVLK